jgi:hypothetical protein
MFNSRTPLEGSLKPDYLDPDFYFNVVVSLMIGPRVKAAFRS